MPRITSSEEPVDLDLFDKDSFGLTLQFHEAGLDVSGMRTKTPLDITGWNFTATWRPNTIDPRTVAWQFVDRQDSQGIIAIEITPAMFTTMRAISTTGVWDLQVTYPDTSSQTMIIGDVWAGVR